MSYSAGYGERGRVEKELFAKKKQVGKIKKVRPVRKTRNVGRLNARTLDFFWEKEIERNHMRKKNARNLPGVFFRGAMELVFAQIIDALFNLADVVLPIGFVLDYKVTVVALPVELSQDAFYIEGALSEGNALIVDVVKSHFVFHVHRGDEPFECLEALD